MKRFLPAILLLLLGGTFPVQEAPPRPFSFSEILPAELPFDSGEKLTFEVNWKPLFLLPAMKVGEITLSIERSEYQGEKTYRIRGWAQSDGSLTQMAGLEVRDYFESQVDQETFRPYWNLQETREGKRWRDLQLIFDYERDQTQIRETDPAADPVRVLRTQVRSGIPSPAVDVLSAFYVTRLRKPPEGEEFGFHLNERGQFREVRVTGAGEGEVETPLGAFPSYRLSTTGGLFRAGGDLSIWYSNDQWRVPLRFEADVRFGKVFGTLIRMETPRLTRSLIRVQ